MVDGAQQSIPLIAGKTSNLKTKMKFMEFTCFLSNLMAICRMLAKYMLYPQLHFDNISKGSRYKTINTVFEWANKNGTIEEKTVDKQKAIFSILDGLFKE